MSSCLWRQLKLPLKTKLWQSRWKSCARSLGYQLVSQKISFDEKLKQGDKLKALVRIPQPGCGSTASPIERIRQATLPAATSVKWNSATNQAKPVAQSLHTPQPPTNQWQAGKAITWSEELKMPPLKPGKYGVFVSVVDVDTKRKLQILNRLQHARQTNGRICHRRWSGLARRVGNEIQNGRDRGAKSKDLPLETQLLEALSKIESFKKCAFLDYPDHLNSGDHLIWLGTCFYLIETRKAEITYTSSLVDFQSNRTKRENGNAPIFTRRRQFRRHMARTAKKFRRK